MTEINDYLKLLWPRIAKAFCPSCGREIRPETAKSIADEILRDCADKNVLITFWVSVPAKTEPRKFFDFLQQQGYLRVWIDNESCAWTSIQKSQTPRRAGAGHSRSDHDRQRKPRPIS